MNNLKKILTLLTSLSIAANLSGANITWIAQTPNNDVEDINNWSGGSVPTSVEIATFDSTIANISTNPTEQTNPFSVNSFQFSHAASPFIFTFNKQILNFTGTGITGNQTNTTINAVNTNNTSFLANQILFSWGNNTSGSAVINASNIGNTPGAGVIAQQIHSSAPFAILNNGSLSVSNQGTLSQTSSTSGAIITTEQVLFDSTITAADNVTLSATNSGTFTGSATTTGSTVGQVVAHQFNTIGAFQGGDNLVFTATNTGVNNSTGSGNHHVGVISNSQIELGNTCIVGDNARITVSNSGSNSGNGTLTNTVGYVNEQQFHVVDTFQAGDNLTITTLNTGFDNSTGDGGHLTGVIDSNSGTEGIQIQFDHSCSVGNNASFIAENTGTYEGTNTVRGSIVASLNQGQLLFKENFSALDHLNISASNKGIDSAVGIGNDVAGALSAEQVRFNTSCAIGDYASISISNRGNYSGQNSTIFNAVGTTPTSQFYCDGSFEAGNFFNLTAANEGVDSSQGTGFNFIGTVASASGAQITFNNTCVLGDNANIAIKNTAINSNHSSAGGGQLATFIHGGQFHAEGQFQAGNHFNLQVENTGNDSSTNTGGSSYIAYADHSNILFNGGCHLGDHASISMANSGSYTGTNTLFGNLVGSNANDLFFIQESLNTGDYFSLNVKNTAFDSSQGNGGDYIGSMGYQARLLGGFSLGDYATIKMENTGTYTGTNATHPNVVGVINIQQFYSPANLLAGNHFTLGISNHGDCNTSGNGNTVGNITTSQFSLNADCQLGDNATLLIENKGENGSTGTTNAVGCMNNSQLLINGKFVAGSNLSLSVSNQAINAGDGNNFVGNIGSTQLALKNTVALGDGCSISVYNNGNHYGTTSLTNNPLGAVNDQLYVVGEFTAGNAFSLNVVNSASDSSQGLGNNLIASMSDQVQFNDRCTFGDQAALTVVNGGVYSGHNSTSSNVVGSINAPQLTFLGDVVAGNQFKLNLRNSGDCNTSGTGNQVGCIAGAQCNPVTGLILGNEASVLIENRGINQGEGSNNIVGAVQNSQLLLTEAFIAGSDSTIGIFNTAFSNTSGQSNLVGNLSSAQLNLVNDCTLGNHSILIIENNAIHEGAGTLNTVGCINSSQVKLHGNFVTGSNSIFSVSNKDKNTGDSNNNVGIVNGSQLAFENAVTIDKGTLFSVYNDGTIVNSQMLFTQGFQLLSGKAQFLAWNEGNVGDYGIEILGSHCGGDVNITLGNTSLHIDTSTPTFTIGELNGDSRATVQSKPTLIIDTDKDAKGNFAGNIQNFPSITSPLIKRGIGSQELSGSNTYTGLTTIEEGVLILTGRIATDVTINPQGTLKGTGVVGRNVLNTGTIAPGLSIGTLTIEGNLINNHGSYELEINTQGKSDLIVVNGTATLNGGVVEVLPEEDVYLFQHPYTILTASKVNGKFSKAIGSPSPLLLTNLKYDSKQIYLILQQDISKAAETDNQKAIATQLDGIKNPNLNQNMLLNEMVNLSFYEVRDSLDSLSGYQQTDDVWTMQMVSRQFIRRLYHPLRPLVTMTCTCDCEEYLNEWTCWMEAEGGASTLKGNQNSHHLQLNHYEMTAGFQKTLFHSLTLGFAGSYEYDQMHYRDGGSGKNSNYLVALYGLYRPSLFYTLVDFAYGYSSDAINRSIEVGSLKYTARSKPIISQFDFYSELGMDFFINTFLLQPFVGIQTGNYWRHHVKEHNANGLELTINKKEWAITTSRLGMHLSTQCQDGEFSLDLAWNRLLSDRKNEIKGRFIEFGREYTIAGIALGSNSIDYALTFSQSFQGGLNGYLEFSGESWKSASNYSLVGGINFEW